MFEEMKAARIHSVRGPESSTSAEQSRHFARFVELRNTMPSDVEIISSLVDQLKRFISRFQDADGNNFGIEVALREGLANAVVHGNQEDPHKCVYVTFRCTTDGDVSITIQDEGQGFESQTEPDPTAPVSRLPTSGRGIYLMKSLMDEVRFEQKGTVVHMRKRFQAGSGAKRETR